MAFKANKKQPFWWLMGSGLWVFVLGIKELVGLFTDKPLFSFVSMPHFSLNWSWLVPPVGFAVAGWLYYKERKSNAVGAFTVELETTPGTEFWISSKSILVRNNSERAMTHVIVEVVGLKQSPQQVHKLPSHWRLMGVPPSDGILNPKSTASFPIVSIATTGGQREIAMFPVAGGTKPFLDGMTAVAAGQSYCFEVRVSSAEFPAVIYTVELKLIFVPKFDDGTLPFGKGFDISIRKSDMKKP